MEKNELYITIASTKAGESNYNGAIPTMDKAAILSSIAEANAGKNLLRPSWTTVKAVFVPCTGTPSLMSMRVSPIVSADAARLVEEGDDDYLEVIANHGDSTVQSEMMKLLCDQPGSERYKLASEYMRMGMANSTANTSLPGVDLSTPNWYPLLSDSCRVQIYGDGDDNGVAVSAFFLGADNGYNVGAALFPSLPLNENFNREIRGPVLIYIAKFVEMENGYEHEVFIDAPTNIVNDAEFLQFVKEGIHGRYADAELTV